MKADAPKTYDLKCEIQRIEDELWMANVDSARSVELAKQLDNLKAELTQLTGKDGAE